MNFNVAKRRILKVIRKFEKNVILFDESDVNIINGKPIKTKTEKIIKMAVMSFDNQLPNDTYNSTSVIDDKKEAYYRLSQGHKISQNMLVKVDEVIYRINKIEENYKSFIRMELIINDKRT